MRKRMNISKMITKQKSFRRISKVMKLQMKQASKLSEMLQRAQARTGVLTKDDEPPYGATEDLAPFDQGA